MKIYEMEMRSKWEGKESDEGRPRRICIEATDMNEAWASAMKLNQDPEGRTVFGDGVEEFSVLVKEVESAK